MKRKAYNKMKKMRTMKHIRKLMVLAVLLITSLTAGAQTTYNYYALHVNSKGYMKQCKGKVYNDGTFRYENAYDGNGSSIWIYSSDGYLQQEMYYLNVANDQTLYLSTTPVTQWDLVDDGGKNRFQLHNTTKVLGLDGSKNVILNDSPTDKYTACTLDVTMTGKWEGPKDVSWTVQSPQLITYLRAYYLCNITVTIIKNDAGSENVTVVSGKDARAHCMLTYKSSSTGDKGTKWDINTTSQVIYNMQASNNIKVTATCDLTPLNPIIRDTKGIATDKSVTITVTPKAFAPNADKKYLMFNTHESSYRFPKATSSISEDALLPVDGNQSDLTEAVNGEIAWVVEVDAEGFYSFKNVTTERYFYYDASDYSVSDYGALKIGSTAPAASDTRYKFRLFSGGVSLDPYGTCLYIIPYDKQFAVWKSDGTLEELYFAIYVNKANATKIASIYKAANDAKWKLYSYEWENRVWDNFSIVGDQNVYTAGNHAYTATTWFSRNIKESPKNTDVCAQGSKTKEGITYTWTLTGLDDYTVTADATVSGTSTFTATVTLPPSTRAGSLTVVAAKSGKSVTKTIPLTLYNLNPTYTEIDELSDITNANGIYRLTADNTYGASSNKPGVATFNGTLDCNGHTIKGLSAPLFTTLTGTVKNLVIESVDISGGANVGAIACTANSVARIYNVGILSGSVGGSGDVGGLVGQLDGTARVVNCYSYADITGGTNVGGIVGNNKVATASNNLKTMVFGCMFYGDITGGTNKSPIYGGNNISNAGDNGVSNYNYFWIEAPYVQPTGITYNCALGAEKRFLNRFEFFRHLLNGHRELAGWWATGTYDKNEMLKWVLLPDSIGSDHPYPILMQQGKYPSVVNLDAANAQVGKPRNQGGKLGELAVHIQMGSGGAVYGAPADAAITTSDTTLIITDKDTAHFNYNYYKVQLPYYNEVGTKNYNGNRVVTGWKIVSITGGTPGTFTASDTWGGYNFADRHCTNKDLYSVSGRIFNQGAYWDVPEGVTAITIEPYWARCTYLADAYADVVYNSSMETKYDVPNVGGGAIYSDNNSYTIAGESQVVRTSVGNAVTTLFNGVTENTSKNQSVYDYAIVLVGNAHNIGASSDKANRPFTVMSIDADHDNEPDYTYILRFNGRTEFHPVRADFINIPGLGMAQKSTGGTGSYNFGIMIPKRWFESTNTSLFRFTQFEYENSAKTTTDALILQGGVMEQWVSYNQKGRSNNIPYIHVGGNVWFKEFHTGCHQDKNQTSGGNQFQPTKHSPISVTGGDYDEFYLTGLYVANAGLDNYADNAECYINGGRFGTVCGAAMEGIGKANGADNTGNISWLIQNADIREFFAGGLNAAKPVTGNLSTTIVDSHVDIFCGGPKFGDMSTGKTVVTNATGCTFGTFFGAGYGGNSYSRYAPSNQNNVGNINWNNWVSEQYTRAYNVTYGGVSTRFLYQFLPMSDNKTNVARILIDFVKFSLATTHEVTSSLKHCSITDNFYGGGSLGKVDGTVTSILDSCTVMGNVFGAGFSALLPTVEVDSIGFRVEPYYYDALGTYRTGVKGRTTTYTWEEGNSISVDNTNHILYTTEDLDALGTVGGNVTLTLKGTTTVGTLEGGSRKAGTGNVFGGGDMSGVIGGGNTTVILEGGAHVLGDVFGGGNQGAVGGNSSVTLQ